MPGREWHDLDQYEEQYFTTSHSHPLHLTYRLLNRALRGEHEMIKLQTTGIGCHTHDFKTKTNLFFEQKLHKQHVKSRGNCLMECLFIRLFTYLITEFTQGAPYKDNDVHMRARAEPN